MSSDVCGICLETMENRQHVYEVNCRHQLHGQCGLTWFRRNNTCPLCRNEVTEMRNISTNETVPIQRARTRFMASYIPFTRSPLRIRRNTNQISFTTARALYTQNIVAIEQTEDFPLLCDLCEQVMQHQRYECPSCQESYCVNCAFENRFYLSCTFCEGIWSSRSMSLNIDNETTNNRLALLLDSTEEKSESTHLSSEQTRSTEETISTEETRSTEETVNVQQMQSLQSLNTNVPEEETNENDGVSIIASVIQMAHERRMRRRRRQVSDSESQFENEVEQQPPRRRRRIQ